MEKITNKKNSLYESKAFRKGVEDFRAGRMSKYEVKVYWVKKKITIKDWKEYYSKTQGYCFLSKEKNEIWIGFIKGKSPGNMKLCNDEELRRIDEYCRAYNILPTPLENK